ncbi:NAD(P)/FAD-dependent oxidoreductase [Shewanella decolorationis]|uniref:Amine oxidase n=1 Tax=Shewanella decolorationis S12 TaxID=1353536 RepID=A0ABP2Z9B2_9GAMM|nr:FAD-dependent oxidoreductase [Shewanella decolorationis]ESE41934.1 amine oxidase [Shewanella decolorationis S12]GLR32137.1 amine oxidase [Shewanella decolorationis]
MKNIAIVGTGISGLTCGYLLSQAHKVTVFEANDYIGGHTATVDVEHHGKHYAIDTGFIVFNDRTYPRFERLLARLNVSILPTEMSFSVHNALTGLEYNGHNFASLFAQKRNLLNPRFWAFLNEIVRFNKSCKAIYQQDNYPAGNLGEFLDREQFSRFFAEHYILPMGAAIWSSSIEDMRAFSLRFFIRFFEHHGLLNVSNRPQWYVLKGGSRSYIPDLIAPFKDNLHLNSPVRAIERYADGVKLYVNGEWQVFDEVILACHSDQALKMLTDATSAEKAILGDLQYQDNEVVLHTDTRLLPKRKAAWASWNYRLDGNQKRPASVTYNMNILQRLPSDAPTFCVTLNQTELIDESKILRRFNYAHPVFNELSLQAQARREEISGQNHTHFAGAYWHNGFHEDGVRSALDVCAHFGIDL